MSNTVKMTYKGGLDAVDAYFPSTGRAVTVGRGEAVELMLPEAASVSAAEWTCSQKDAKAIADFLSKDDTPEAEEAETEEGDED